MPIKIRHTNIIKTANLLRLLDDVKDTKSLTKYKPIILRTVEKKKRQQ